MSFRVSGKNIDIGEALRTRVSSRVAEAVGKHFNGGYSGHVTVGKEAYGFRTECVVHLDSGIVLQSDAMAGDAYSSADQAAERIEKRLRRYGRRLKDRHNARVNGRQSEALESGIDAPSYVIEAPADEADDTAEFAPVIIAESTTILRSLSVSDAVLELDMTGDSVLVFRHAGHGRVNVVYRRADGHIGWVDPPAMDRTGH
jgi:ribosomal subunit interface protein